MIVAMIPVAKTIRRSFFLPHPRTQGSYARFVRAASKLDTLKGMPSSIRVMIGPFAGNIMHSRKPPSSYSVYRVTALVDPTAYHCMSRHAEDNAGYVTIIA